MWPILWNRHYHAGVTGNYHGDAALAYVAILADPECDRDVANQIRIAAGIHMNLERRWDHEGRKWFCEQFGTRDERRANWTDEGVEEVTAGLPEATGSAAHGCL